MPPALTLPEQLGRYRILNCLGKGGMGTVFLAHDLPLDRKVALKIMTLEGDDAIQRFFREARAAAALEHPNICPIYDVGRVGEIHYITMKYIEGTPLSEAFTPNQPLQPRHAAELGQTLALALEAMHRKGIIHRDIKPANVVLAPLGQPVLVDFGLARWVNGRRLGISQPGQILGTPAYMAPEQVRGEVDQLGPSCDIYSLGALLYEVLTGVRPFPGLDLGSLFYQIVHTAPLPPQSRRPGLDPLLGAICLKALAKRPEDRFATMAEFAAELQRFLHPPAAAPVPADAGWTVVSDLAVRLQPVFDRDGYPHTEESTAYCLLELEVRPEKSSVDGGEEGVTADLMLVLDVSGSMDTPDKYPLLRRALVEFLQHLAPDDRVGIAIFSAGAELVLRPAPGAEVARVAPAILERMDHSPLTFGGATQLAPGLRHALAALEGLPARDSVRRVYVLTDGELHDTEACRQVLADFRPSKTEVHVYGFGTGFDAAALKRLVSDQLGGSVKPICNEQDIINTFAHVAKVNRRLTARDGVLTLEFDPAVVCGDAWTFRPQERHLGRIEHRRVVRELGGLEANRTYTFLVEVGLPPDSGPRTRLAQVRLTWGNGGQRAEYRVELEAPRLAPGKQAHPVARVGQAVAILDALRRPDDSASQVSAARSRLQLAREEERDSGYITALEKQLDVLEGRVPASQIDARDEQYLEADPSTASTVGTESYIDPRDKEFLGIVGQIQGLIEFLKFKDTDPASQGAQRVLNRLEKLLAIVDGRCPASELSTEEKRKLVANTGSLFTDPDSIDQLIAHAARQREK
jgi:Mg-chelatase subunit ChlD/predicted Ser/Thr protein kinase